MTVPKPTCKNCKWSAMEYCGIGSVLVCKRHAPQGPRARGSITAGHTLFTPVGGDDWCGDWEESEGG